MKILNAHVWDPRGASTYRDPEFHVEVDEEVWEVSDPIVVPGFELYRQIRCGPFTAIEYRTGEHDWEDAGLGNPGDVGYFNTYGLTPQLMAVKVDTPTEVVDLYMTVERARRIVRKYDIAYDWHVILDEQSAMQAMLKWRVERIRPVCYGGATIGSAHCRRTGSETVVYQGTHLTLCPHHKVQLEGRFRKHRVGAP